MPKERTLTVLDLRLGFGLTEEQKAEHNRRLAPAFARIIRRLLTEEARRSRPASASSK